MVRTSRSEFIVSVNKYLEARSHKLSVGMRLKMTFEGEEVPERRYFSRLFSLFKVLNCGQISLVKEKNFKILF